MQQKHALIIGVDKYAKLHRQYQLSGCVNDAKLVRSVLVEHFNFPPDSIAELHNEAATRDAIVASMEALLERAGSDDIVVFHFSGHGSRRTSATPNEEEGSGRDSTIMPHDSGRDPHPNRDIIDDDIHAWLLRLTEKTSNVTLTFDCCHSGTITRDAFGAQTRSVPDDTRSLEDMGIDTASLPMLPAGARGTTGASGWLRVSDRYVVMSGCRDNELSHEYTMQSNGQTVRNGALTHYLTGALMRAVPGTTYRDVFEIARQSVNTRFSNQNPQIEGTQDREIFGTRDIEPLRFISVGAVDGSDVSLRGGAAHGLATGALWSVYPPGTKTTDGVEALGVLKIDSVGPVSADARIVERHGDIMPGARCVESAPSAEQFILKVDLTPLADEQRSALAQVIADSALLATSDVAEAADARAYVLAPRDGAANDDPVPQVARVETPTWAIVDREGALAMPLHAVSKDGVIDTLVRNLETMSRYRNALLLNNPGGALDVKFNILKQDASGDWVSANGGDSLFTAGDRIAFEVINDEDREVFVSVLDFGLTGKVAQFYPPNRGSEMIAPGHTMRIGAGSRKIRLGVPDALQANSGVETFKAFVTTAETDFRWLQQEGMRSAESAKSRLRQQFEAAYNGPATRDVSFDDGDDDDEWIAINRAFILQRG